MILNNRNGSIALNNKCLFHTLAFAHVWTARSKDKAALKFLIVLSGLASIVISTKSQLCFKSILTLAFAQLNTFDLAVNFRVKNVLEKTNN